MKHSNEVSILVFLVLVFMAGLWTIDMSPSAMLTDGVMTSG